jgi:hypothetical protein
MGAVMNRATTVLLLLLLSLAAPTLHAAGMQSMAIPAGVYAVFKNGGAAEILAFCIDKAKETPWRNAKFDAFVGRVRVSLTDGRTLDLDLDRAAPYLTIEGSGSHTSVRLIAHQSVVKVEFLTASAAHSGSRQTLQRTADFLPHFAKISLQGSPADIAERVWRSSLMTRRTESSLGTPPSVDIEYLRRDPAATLTQRFRNLNGRGDSAFMRTPNGSAVILDTGLSARQFESLVSDVKPGEPVTVLVTHPDADHLGNLPRLLTDDRVTIERIVMSDWQSESQLYQQVLADLADLGFRRTGVPNSRMVTFTRPPPPKTMTLSNGRRFTLNSDFLLFSKYPFPTGFSQFSELPLSGFPNIEIAGFQLTLDDSVNMHVYQMTVPNSSNQSSLVTAIEHNGYRTLHLGDADTGTLRALTSAARSHAESVVWVAMDRLLLRSEPDAHARHVAERASKRALDRQMQRSYAAINEREADGMFKILAADGVEENAIREEIQAVRRNSVRLKADIVKWPHHAWLPPTAAERAALKAFLDEVDPTRIILSVPPTDLKGQSTDAVRAFLKEWRSTIEVFVTGADGTVTLMTDRQIEALQPAA